MRVLLTLLYLSLFLGTTAQKLKYIHFKGPEGARLYLSKQRPFVIEDSIHNLTGTTYLGTTKGTAALASNRFPSSYGTNYLIVEKQGYKVSISKLNLQRVDKVNYKVSKGHQFSKERMQTHCWSQLDRQATPRGENRTIRTYRSFPNERWGGQGLGT